ncbi:hypothetical protein [Ralstonia solanacearum]|uniref:hypothetical protein n=1 Tax=Ralstonia solanacearum TaxID=305 RepID=UPI001E4E98F5|nr:hypothetical protein [Ralstonia solanacearum]
MAISEPRNKLARTCIPCLLPRLILIFNPHFFPTVLFCGEGCPFEVDVETAIGPAELAAFLWAASVAGASTLTVFLLAAFAGASV